MEEGPVFPEQMITVEEGDDAEFILAKQIARMCSAKGKGRKKRFDNNEKSGCTCELVLRA